MFGLVTMKSIRTDFDAVMRKNGYERTKVMCEKWGITQNQLSKAIQKGFECDSFIVNGVRYVSIYADPPAVEKKTKKNETETMDITLTEVEDDYES